MSDRVEDHVSEAEESDMEYEDGEQDIATLLQGLLLDGKKSRNIPDVLCEIKRNMEAHNQLMFRLVKAIEAKNIP
jgi:hypothetical protein|tara:strand:+ start:10115 stop:10339 length:225 start_codon:yes stop_codon:yes gene_type:complete